MQLRSEVEHVLHDAHNAAELTSFCSLRVHSSDAFSKYLQMQLEQIYVVFVVALCVVTLSHVLILRFDSFHLQVRFI